MKTLFLGAIGLLLFFLANRTLLEKKTVVTKISNHNHGYEKVLSDGTFVNFIFHKPNRTLTATIKEKQKNKKQSDTKQIRTYYTERKTDEQINTEQKEKRRQITQRNHKNRNDKTIDMNKQRVLYDCA